MADEILPNSGMELPDIGGDQDTWGDILNENLRILDRAITLGAESIALAATDVTLDEDQATKGVLRLSGVLTANVNVVVPASPVRLYLVENNTTGAFTVAIKTPLGTGVTVLQGTSSLVYSNGTNVVQGATSVNGSFAVSGGFSAGSINNTPIGATTPNTGAFTNLSYTGTLTGGTGVINIGSGQLVKDAAGNLGLSLTPSAWASNWKVFQSLGGFIGSNATDGYRFANNSYSDGTNWRYVATGEASAYQQLDGGHAWFTAPSGTAGNPITFTQAMTLTQGGNLLIGTTSDIGSKLDVASSGVNLVADLRTGPGFSALFEFAANGNGVGSTSLAVGQLSDSSAVVSNRASAPLIFGTANAERARIASSGYFKASNTGIYGGVAGVGDLTSSTQHMFQSNENTDTLLSVNGLTSSGVNNFTSILASGATGVHFRGVLNLVDVYRVAANGDVQNTNNSYGAISDAKLKNIIAARDGKHYWEKFKKIKFWIYSLLADPTNQQLLGVVAQEFREIFPSLVNSSPDMHAVKKTREVTTEIQVTKPVQKEQIRTEIASEGGRYIQKQIIETVTVDEPVFDQFPLYDETGSLVMQLVSAEEPPQVDEKGEEISPAKPAVYAPVIHQVPRMTTVTTTEEYEEMEPNGEVTLSVNYSILGLIADTITQELQFRVEDLTARLEALEAQ